MDSTQIAVIAAIEAQQKKTKPESAPWMVGEQLKEICEREPKSAALLMKDLELKEMSIVEAEKKIKAWADQHKTGNFACVSPKTAEKILREFYGLGEMDSSTSLRSAQNDRMGETGNNRTKAPVITLEDFF